MYQNIRRFFLPTARCWDADSERSYQDLFERLDTNKDGKVDVAELRAGLKAMGIFRQGAAQVQLRLAMRVLMTVVHSEGVPGLGLFTFAWNSHRVETRNVSEMRG